jgi:hypothetical protein
MAQQELADPCVRIALSLRVFPRFLLLQSVEPLIERFQPRVGWKLRDLAGFVLSHVSPLCVAPARKSQGQARTRNMAESKTAKARTLYEGRFG